MGDSVFDFQVQGSDPEHLLSQRHVPGPSANRLLGNKGTAAHAVGSSDGLCTRVLI